ncbi:hypothetical protein EDC04DRAFT_2605525 [Pisolithus marmoratus]|nr:hypothetical protein EDC04DRAFT_2605525 [Pisolithus marmoratus]
MCLFNLPRKRKGLKCILPEDIVVFNTELRKELVFEHPFGSNRSRSVIKRYNRGGRGVHAVRCRFEKLLEDVLLVDTPSFYVDHDGPEADAILKEWMDVNTLEGCWAISAFQRTCREDLTGYTIYVIKTLLPGVEEEGALMHPILFDGKPEDAWDILQTLFNKIEPVLLLHLRQWIARWDLPSPLLPSITQ